MDVGRFDRISRVQLHGVQVLTELDEVDEVLVVAGPASTDNISRVWWTTHSGEDDIVTSDLLTPGWITGMHRELCRGRANKVQDHLGLETHAIAVQACTMFEEQLLGLREQDVHTGRAQQRE